MEARSKQGTLVSAFQNWLLVLNRLYCSKITFGVTLASSLGFQWLGDRWLAELEHGGERGACLFSLENGL